MNSSQEICNERAITIDTLFEANIDTIIISLEQRTCESYYAEFERLVIQEKQENNKELQTIYSLFLRITSMSLKANDDRKPLRPMFVWNNGHRGTIPEDLSVTTLNLLEVFYQKLEDVELKARIADILWLRRRKPIFASDAVNAYLASAHNLCDDPNWSLCTDRIERALRLSHQCRKQQPELFANIVKYMEETIFGEDNLALSFKFLDLLADFKAGDIQTCLNRAWNLAQTEPGWQLAEKWARVAKDGEKINLAIEKRIELLVLKATLMDQGLCSAELIRQAMALHKKIPGSKARQAELYQHLRSFQKNSLTQMQNLGHEVDLSDSIEKARNMIIGLSFEEDLFSLAFSIAGPLCVDDLKRPEKSIISQLFGHTYMDSKGLIVGYSSPCVTANLDEEGLDYDELCSIKIFHQLIVGGAIAPAREKFIVEHHVSEEMFFKYVQNNTLIPAGHEYLFAKGLYAGLTGDFITALSILIPQIENSFRYVLQESGIETTQLKTHQAQEHILLSSILNNKKFKAIFGEDLILDLKALLIERKYANLRNKVGHGVMTKNDFFQPACIYLWWLILRIILEPSHQNFNKQSSITETQEEEV